MLTSAQVDHYRSFGFVVLRQYFTPSEVAALQREAEAELVHQYRDRPFDGTLRHFTCMLDERVPTFAGLLDDPRFFGVADQLHGESLPVWCDANRYNEPFTGWHPDLHPEYPRAGIKFCHYLQPLRSTTGALRVIPGSHVEPLHGQVLAYLASASPRIEDLPAYVCESDPGDVIVFNINLFHASLGGKPDRRLCTLAYYTMPRPGDETATLMKLIRDQLPVTRRVYHWQGEVYPASWIARAAWDPIRRLAVERMQRAGVFAAQGADAGLAARVLEQSTVPSA